MADHSPDALRSLVSAQGNGPNCSLLCALRVPDQTWNGGVGGLFRIVWPRLVDRRRTASWKVEAGPAGLRRSATPIRPMICAAAAVPCASDGLTTGSPDTASTAPGAGEGIAGWSSAPSWCGRFRAATGAGCQTRGHSISARVWLHTLFVDAGERLVASSGACTIKIN